LFSFQKRKRFFQAQPHATHVQRVLRARHEFSLSLFVDSSAKVIQLSAEHPLRTSLARQSAGAGTPGRS